MKLLISILLILGFLWVVQKMAIQYEHAKREGIDSSRTETSGGPPAADASQLPGMPISIESALQAAQKQGADGLAEFLRQYRHAIRDPRLAAIELDYAVLLNLKNPEESRRVFKSVQERTPRSSPVYDRIKRLEKTYQ